MTPQPEDAGIMATLAAMAWAAASVLLAIVWKNNEAAIKGAKTAAADALLAHTNEDDKRFKAINDEQAIQRGHIANLFDRIDAHARRSEERHHELMQRSHDAHRELLMVLNSKADK